MNIPILIDDISTHMSKIINNVEKFQVYCHSPLIPGTNSLSNYLSCKVVKTDGSIKIIILEKKNSTQSNL